MRERDIEWWTPALRYPHFIGSLPAKGEARDASVAALGAKIDTDW